MKKSIQILALVLSLSLLLCGCGGAEAAQTTAPTTQPTEPVTEPTEPAPIDNEEALIAALDANGRVTIEGDMTMTKGVPVKGNLLDGGGHTLTPPVYNEEDPNTSAALFITKGTIENVTIKGGHRGIGTTSEYRATGEIRIKNVDLDGENCGLYIGSGDNQGAMYVENSSLGSQTVFNKVTHAQFTNCTFHWNASGTKGNMTAYSNVTIVGCRFENLVLEDGTVKLYTIAFPNSVDGLTMTLEDCYVGDTLITPENINRLLKVQPRKCTIQVRNTGR